MLAAAYTLAAIPEPCQILGLRLRPFCLGHYFLMSRFGVAFVSEEPADATFQDLVLGALICSMRYEEFLEFLDQPDRDAQIKAWGAKAGIEFDLPAKVRIFNQYLAKAFQQPVVVFEGEQSNSGAHWAQTVKVTLIDLGYSESEAMNLPLSQAFADFYKHAESQGLVTIANEELAALLMMAENICEDGGPSGLPPEISQPTPYVPPPPLPYSPEGGIFA